MKTWIRLKLRPESYSDWSSTQTHTETQFELMVRLALDSEWDSTETQTETQFGFRLRFDLDLDWDLTQSQTETKLRLGLKLDSDWDWICYSDSDWDLTWTQTIQDGQLVFLRFLSFMLKTKKKRRFLSFLLSWYSFQHWRMVTFMHATFVHNIHVWPFCTEKRCQEKLSKILNIRSWPESNRLGNSTSH